VRRRTTEDRHLPPPCRFGRHFMVIDASLFGGKGVCEELRCQRSGFIFRRYVAADRRVQVSMVWFLGHCVGLLTSVT
jgi:hypothetical protein